MPRNVTEEGPHPVDRHVGRLVRDLRLERGLNQSDLAKALGLTFQQVQKYEKGTNRISASKLWDISVFLDVAIDYFFRGLDGADILEEELAEPAAPSTRQSLEIGRLVRQLPARQQRLALDLIRSLTIS